MATWVYALPDTICGHCGVPISAGLPTALVTPAKRPRCSSCAHQMGLVFDPTTLPPITDAEAARLAAEAGIDRLRRQRRLNFDPHVHAAG